MKLVNLKVDEIKPSPFNPPVRTDHTNLKYKALRRSVRRVGILVPLSVTNDYTLIDGNRRLEIAKELNMKEVPTIVNGSESMARFDEYFVEANENTMPMTSAQELYRYMKGARISRSTKRAIEHLKEIGGITLLKDILKTGKSPVTFHIAVNQYKNYAKDHNNPSELQQVMYWMLKVGSPYKLKSAIGNYIPLSVLLEAVTKRIPLKTTITI